MIFKNSHGTILFQGDGRRGDKSGLNCNYFTEGLWKSYGFYLTYKNIPKINAVSVSKAITLLSPTELIEWSEEDENISY